MIISRSYIDCHTKHTWNAMMTTSVRCQSEQSTNKQTARRPREGRNSLYSSGPVSSLAVSYFSFPGFCPSDRAAWGEDFFPQISLVKLTWCWLELTQHIPPLTDRLLQSRAIRQTVPSDKLIIFLHIRADTTQDDNDLFSLDILLNAANIM